MWLTTGDMLRTIAVTGGIGSGKSLVCRFLEERGFPVYDSDGRTKSLYVRDMELTGRIREKMAHFVPEAEGMADGFLLADGKLDLKRLSSIVFRNAEARLLLESIVHPAVLQDFMAWKDSPETAGRASHGAVVIESAIILEKPLFRDVIDTAVLVTAPAEVRLGRSAARDGVPPESIRKRMEAQGELSSEANGKIGFIIVNDGTPDDLRRKVDQFIDSNYRK